MDHPTGLAVHDDVLFVAEQVRPRDAASMHPPSFFLISHVFIVPARATSYITTTCTMMHQTRNVVLSFNVTSGRYIRQVIGALNTDGIESIALSDC